MTLPVSLVIKLGRPFTICLKPHVGAIICASGVDQSALLDHLLDLDRGQLGVLGGWDGNGLLRARMMTLCSHHGVEWSDGPPPPRAIGGCSRNEDGISNQDAQMASEKIQRRV